MYRLDPSSPKPLPRKLADDASGAGGGGAPATPAYTALLQRKIAQRVAQRRADGQAESAPAMAAPSGGGAAPPEGVQRKMGDAFGADFSSVRVHQGAHVSSLGAEAYAQGEDVHFAP